VEAINRVDSRERLFGIGSCLVEAINSVDNRERLFEDYEYMQPSSSANYRRISREIQWLLLPLWTIILGLKSLQDRVEKHLILRINRLDKTWFTWRFWYMSKGDFTLRWQ
jgi:hypothetical protein